MNQYQKDVFRKRVQDVIQFTQNLDAELRDASAMVNSIRQDLTHIPNTRVNDFERFAEAKLIALKENAKEFSPFVDRTLSMLRGLHDPIPEAPPAPSPAAQPPPAAKEGDAAK